MREEPIVGVHTVARKKFGRMSQTLALALLYHVRWKTRLHGDKRVVGRVSSIDVTAAAATCYDAPTLVTTRSAMLAWLVTGRESMAMRYDE